VEAGFGHLVGFDRKKITRAAIELLGKPPINLRNPFGDGKASSKICKLANDFLEDSKVRV
jgi:UDP-N-acetylglucosamine 2-epimerase